MRDEQEKINLYLASLNSASSWATAGSDNPGSLRREQQDLP